MDLAAIATIISLVVLVLQIITLVLIGKTRKSLADLKIASPIAPSNERERYGKRDFEGRRHEKRYFHDQKPRQQLQQSQSAPSLPSSNDVKEQSLRDINLRLKSAERDQESVRRRLQDRMPREANQNRNDRGKNRGRDRDHRHGNRDHRRGNWQERHDRQSHNRPQAVQGQPPPPNTPPAPAEEPVFEKITSLAPDTTAAPTIATHASVAEPNMQPVDFASEEELQHGRKIIVKRRPLKEDSSNGAQDAAALEDQSAATAPLPASPEEETTFGATEPTDTEIKFGRR
ncbi:MAG: hypothetical protein JW768_07820 [Chitinispirillaceae bacterium]|nr:hypothetical protein [Chitinispirillaceae bacterium]